MAENVDLHSKKKKKHDESQYTLPDDYWEGFMDDIGHKTLLEFLDKGIKLRNQIVRSNVEA